VPVAAKWTLAEVPSPNRVVGFGLLAAAIGFGLESLRLGLWNYGMPGIGLTPLLASIGMLPVSLIVMFDKPVRHDEGAFQPAPLLVGGAFVLYGIGLAYAGLLLPTFLFCLLWGLVIYRKPWPASLAVSLAITGGSWLLFGYLLSIPMPLWIE